MEVVPYTVESYAVSEMKYVTMLWFHHMPCSSQDS